MLSVAAEAGSVGKPPALSGKKLKEIWGGGQFSVDQDGESALLKPVCQDQYDEGGAFGKALDVPVTQPWIAHGSPGKVVRRLSGPIQFVQKLKNSWRLEKTEVASLLGCGPEDAEYVSDILDGKAQPRGRDIQDRIAHLFSIRRTLWSLFRDLDVENEWLRENHPILNGKSPLSLIIEGSMEDLLLAREYVETAAGVR